MFYLLKAACRKISYRNLISNNNDAPNAMGLLTNSLINITRQFILLIGMIIYLLWVEILLQWCYPHYMAHGVANK